MDEFNTYARGLKSFFRLKLLILHWRGKIVSAGTCPAIAAGRWGDDCVVIIDSGGGSYTSDGKTRATRPGLSWWPLLPRASTCHNTRNNNINKTHHHCDDHGQQIVMVE
jgi:hypothetical protein